MTNTTTNHKQKVLIAYHANCIDGFTSAYITAKGFNNLADITLLPMNYNEASDKELCEAVETGSYDELFIVDFSVSVGILAFLNIYDLEVTLLDHHKTAFEKYMPEGYVVKPSSYFEDSLMGTYMVLDNSHSGARICHDFSYGPSVPVPMLVMYVEDYDLWQFDFGEETRWINKYLTSQEQTLERWAQLEEALEDPVKRGEILRAGSELQAKHDAAVKLVAEVAFGVVLDGTCGLQVPCTDKKLTSDVGHELATKAGTFGAMWVKDYNHAHATWSLRSNGDFDVSAICKKFGGGGHKNAGGFTVSLMTHEKLVATSSEWIAPPSEVTGAG